VRYCQSIIIIIIVVVVVVVVRDRVRAGASPFLLFHANSVDLTLAVSRC